MIDWCVDRLACPRDRSPLRVVDPARLVCRSGHEYPVVDGIPVLLVDGVEQTIGVARRSLERAASAVPADALHVDSLGLSERERDAVLSLAARGDCRIDPAVAYLVGATNGIAYRNLVGSLTEYPIPTLRLPSGEGKTLLDIGCSWGRWSIAAARIGYRPLGIDPSLGAVMAARRAARALGVEVRYVVGDARHLPLADDSVDAVFSYSVIQHFSRADAAAAIGEAGRVLRPGGASLIQMPTRWGLRCLYHQARRRFRDGTGFEVRYWTLGALQRLFSTRIGPTAASVDCFFGIGLQASDRHLMPRAYRLAISASEALRAASRFLPRLSHVADSVYLSSVKPGGARAHAS